jgi:hypothetical protein
MMEPSNGDDSNPLAFIDSVGSSGDANAAVSLTSNIDLLGGADPDMNVYELNNRDSDVKEKVEIEEELSGDEDSADGDLLDMAGWNLRRHRNEEGQNVSNTGEDYDTAEVAAAVNNSLGNNKNNNRRGLFGGWGRGRNNDNKSGSSGDIPEGDAGSPSWSNIDGSNDSKVATDGIDELALAHGEGGITGDDDVNDEIIDPELEEEQQMDNELRPGDHIFIWQAYGINPRAYQRHAVVYSVTRKGQTQDMQQLGDEQLSFNLDNVYSDYEDDVEVTVVSFYHFQRHHAAHGASQAAIAASGNSRGKRHGCKRELLHDFIGPDCMSRKKPVHKVRYGRKVKKGLLSQQAGVGTALKKDQPGLILARLQYLLDNQDHLPSHNALSANGECAAMWCVTSKWCTLQGASILAVTSVGQAGGALLAGGILSNLTVLVPMPGLWGMAGWWWYVPATVAYPFLVPTLVALGMCSLVPLEILRRNRKKWRGITDGLNHEFWLNTSDEIKDEYFGTMAAAEREAELRTFFGVKEGDAGADDARYMPVGGAPGGVDDSDDEDEALAMQEMERNCQNMAADINVDLSGKPPPRGNDKGKGWASFMGFSNKKNGSSGFRDDSQDMKYETERINRSFS